jgi:cbb3-type cytochrome oxidase subunit 3
MRIRSLCPAICAAAAIVATFAVSTASAATTVDLGMFDIGSVINLPEGDPRAIIINLINVALQFIGIITLVMILWGGMLFLFSGGKKERTEQAGAIIRNAIIGLIIVLSAWGIARFVLTSISGAVSGDEIPPYLADPSL